jgi:hypothetical protein
LSHSLFPPIAFLDDLQQSEVVVLTLVGVILVTAAFLFGRTWARIERMFQIEKSLSDFYEHEKRKFLDEKAELEERIVRQEKQITELRRKAAGVTGKKDARADLMLQLLVENEQLQEKLFEENVRQKEERDRALGRELHQISYQRVLLSNLLSERGVQEAVVEILGDERRIEKLRAGTPRLDSLPTDAPAAPVDPRTTQP